MKQKMIPEVIAYSKGLNVIPFENVLAIGEDPCVTGQLLVGLNCSSDKVNRFTVPPHEAQEFVKKYNLYLAAVEGLTIESKLVPDDSYPGEVREVTK